MDTVQADANHVRPGLEPGRAGLLLLALAAVFVLLSVLTALLPHDPYIRYQQLRDTIQFRSQWIYERIELDRTPIHVAIVGNSRMGAGVSAPQLQARLQALTGQNIQVANVSLPQEGRNVHYAVAKRLIEAHPELKTIVVSVVEEMPRRGHPAFRNLADVGDVVSAPILINRSYADDVAILPYRQMSLWAQTMAPQLFGVTRTRSPDYAGPGFDTTKTFELPDGRIVERDAIVPEDYLRATAEREILSQSPQVLPDALADYEFAVERAFTRRLGDLARRHGVRIVFLQLPIYSDTRSVGNAAFYESFGPILSANALSGEPTYFADYGHLNRYGSAKASAWLADELVSKNLAGAPAR